MSDIMKLTSGMPQIIAHRGLSGAERENTCAAFVAAGNRSYYGIETDIHRTADGRYIVYHDDDLMRFFGDARVVEEMTFEELRALRLKDLDNQVRGDLVLPSLEEYIRICRKYDKESVLEIKNHFEPEDIQKVIDIIRAEGWLEHTTFISFDLPNVLCIREKLPKQRTQYLVETVDEHVLEILKEKHLDVDADFRSMTMEIADACHAVGALVNVWTVDTIEDAYRMLSCGVDQMTTNVLE